MYKRSSGSRARQTSYRHTQTKANYKSSILSNFLTATQTAFFSIYTVRPTSIDISGVEHHTVQGNKVVLTCHVSIGWTFVLNETLNYGSLGAEGRTIWSIDCQIVRWETENQAEISFLWIFWTQLKSSQLTQGLINRKDPVHFRE